MKGRRRSFLILLLLVSLILGSQAVSGDSGAAAPAITVTLKETQTMKHRTIAEGAVLQISARSDGQRLMSRQLVYRSSDRKVAVVSSSGLIWTLSEGTVEITVSTPDGAKTAAILLTVRDQKNLLTAVM